MEALGAMYGARRVTTRTELKAPLTGRLAAWSEHHARHDAPRHIHHGYEDALTE